MTEPKRVRYVEAVFLLTICFANLTVFVGFLGYIGLMTASLISLSASVVACIVAAVFLTMSVSRRHQSREN